MTQTTQNQKAPRVRAFTLIELLMVLAILVILAGGVIAKLDVLQLRANKGVSASDMGGISRVMQAYVVANNHYPDGYDSLIDPSGPELWGEGYTGAPSAYVGLEPQCVAGPGTTHQKLRALDLNTLATGVPASAINSLTRMGITSLYDLNAASGFPSNAFGGTARALTATATTNFVAVINSTRNGVDYDGTTDLITSGGDGDADDIMNSFYPQTNGISPAGTFVVVFGLGRNSTLIGRSGLLQNAPLYANSGDRNRFYARDLVCFEVSAGGSRARFLGALGADGDRLDEEIAEYYEIQ